MNPPRRPRLGRTIAVALAAFVGGDLTAVEPPEPVPEAGIEIYHGAVKVGPTAPAMRPPTATLVPAPVVELPAPAPLPNPILQVEARVPAAPDARVSEAMVDTLHSVREDTRRVSSAAALVLGRVGTWLKAPQPEPRVIFPVAYSQPLAPPQPSVVPPSVSAPWLTPPLSGSPATVTPPTQVIVIREPAPAPAQPATAPVPTPQVVQLPAAPPPAPIIIRETVPAPAVEPARGITLTPELLIGLAVGLVGVVFGLAGRFRGVREKPAEETPLAAPVAAPTPAVPENVLMVGGYNAGPLPDLAETFDLGPSYEEEQRQKKLAEEQSSQAVLEFILAQNLALQAATAGPQSDGEPGA